MALVLAKESLEERLSNVDNSVLNELVAALKEHRKDVIRSPKLKDDLTPRVVDYFKERDIAFGESYSDAKDYLYKNINKEPLKPVEYGMRISGIPVEFLMKLDDFEKLYFFAGVEKLEIAPELIGEATAYEIASVYIREGIDNMAYWHNSILESNNPSRRRKVTRGEREETYKNPWTPPHSKELRERLVKKEAIYKRIREELTQEFGEFFSEEEKLQNMQIDLFSEMTESERENRLEVVQERIAIKLENLSQFRLELLSGIYGKKAVYQNQ